ncbi:hypothetical protein ABZ354_24955 [Streptomyces sp. NPDC005925]|uniref:hypothetical protein n=1 Tax=Streptomyces sp. NPDC005925 TaxID=3157172 RepID=UPI0033CEE1C1
MHAELTPVVAATAQWMTRAFPAGGGALAAALCEAQARQAVTIAAMLRYPTPMDAALLALAGPGGTARLDWVTGADGPAGDTDHEPDRGRGPARDDHAWRTWVDEVVASWAACLLGDAGLAALAVTALAEGGRPDGAPAGFRRLLAPDDGDRRAAALLRHPDLLAPVADLHRAPLLERLKPGSALIA